MKILQNSFIIARGWSFPISLTSVSLGAIFAIGKGSVSPALYLVCLLGACILHASSNTFNDYFDYKYGVDTPQSPTALYRPHGIFQGLIDPRALLGISLLLLCLALIIGAWLSVTRTALLLPILIAGASLGLLYTALPKKNLKYNSIGEIAVFLAFGPLLMEGSFAVQAQRLSENVLFLSVPVGMLVALVLFANNLRDREFDASKGIRTLATLVSKKEGLRIFMLLALLPYAFIIFYIIIGVLNWTSLLTLFTLPLTIKIISVFMKSVPLASDAIASKISLFFNSFLAISLLLNLIV